MAMCSQDVQLGDHHHHNDPDVISQCSVNTVALEKELEKTHSEERSRLEGLGRKVKYFHASVLYSKFPQKVGSRGQQVRGAFETAVTEARQKLLLKIGGTPGMWRTVGAALRISTSDLNYIQNLEGGDPMDYVLRVFVVRNKEEKGTLDKICEVLVQMGRYDILRVIEEPFLALAKTFCKEDKKEIHDSGYNSNENNSYTCLWDYTQKLPHLFLPPVLDKHCNEQQSPKDRPILFLTYMDDGSATAEKIKHRVANTWFDVPPVTVVTLNDRIEEVRHSRNSVRLINEYLEKADYVVPIVTSSYLQEIMSNNSVVPDASDSLDSKYVKFIFNELMHDYINKWKCSNKKVRSVVPDNVSYEVVTDLENFFILTPYTYEENFDKQFKLFLKPMFEERVSSDKTPVSSG